MGMRMRKGQAMIEYVIVLAMMMVAVAAMTFLVRAARNSSNRTARLVASDSP